MGDMNISHTDRDIGIGEDNRKRWLRTGNAASSRKNVNGSTHCWHGG